MDIQDYPFQRLGSLEIEKSGVDYKASGLSQPLNVQYLQNSEAILSLEMSVNGTSNGIFVNYTSTVRSNPTKNVDGPQSVGFLSVAIPLVISGVVLTFILLLVCYRCRKKQEAYYGEAYEFSLVDQSIQANQSSIIGHGVVMANGTEYQEINDVVDAQEQDNSPVNGILALHDEHGQEESGRYEMDIESRSHKPQSEGHEGPKADSKSGDHKEMIPQTLSTHIYTNDYFSVENLDSTAYFVLELGNEPKYVNER